MTGNASDDLHRAVAALTARERAALQEQSAAAARRWSGTLPGIAAVWTGLAAVVAEINRNERARQATR